LGVTCQQRTDGKKMVYHNNYVPCIDSEHIKTLSSISIMK
jgi:hypothetical protein